LVIWIEFERAAKVLFGVFRLPQERERASQIGMRIGVVGFEFDGLRKF
jgi:hypothetical protein